MCGCEAAEASSLNHGDKPRTLTTLLFACKLTKQLRFNNIRFEYFLFHKKLLRRRGNPS